MVLDMFLVDDKTKHLIPTIYPNTNKFNLSISQILRDRFEWLKVSWGKYISEKILQTNHDKPENADWYSLENSKAKWTIVW